MDYGINKTSSSYTDNANKPFGGIATGDIGNAASTKMQGSLPTTVKKSTPNASYTRTNPDGTSSTIQGYDGSTAPKATPFGSGNNDSSLTDSYTRALKSQQGATAAAQSLSGYTAPEPNQSALPNFSPEQQKAFQSFMGSMFGLNQNPNQQATTGLSQIGADGQPQGFNFGSLFGGTPQTPAAPIYQGEDTTRLSSDPFATTSASRDLFR
jgi:hypothetical protein